MANLLLKAGKNVLIKGGKVVADIIAPDVMKLGSKIGNEFIEKQKNLVKIPDLKDVYIDEALRILKNELNLNPISAIAKPRLGYADESENEVMYSEPKFGTKVDPKTPVKVYYLTQEVIDKSKELANYTLLLSKRKEAFLELTNDLKQLKETVKNNESKNKIVQIFKKLNQNSIGDKYLEIFDVNFERVHSNFFMELKQIDASFSHRDLRLCALIKMNLTNKEVSHILNISNRGVETARYRIRKKLNLSSSESLTLFLENLSNEISE